MNIQQHYDDERLIAMLESDRDPARDAHLSECSACSEALESYRAITDVLRDQSAWTPQPERPPAQVAAWLQDVVATMDRDRVAAAALIEEVLTLPRQWWAMKVAAESRFQTVAVARTLAEKSEAAIDAMPPDAVELAHAATIAADAAGDWQMIGSAWRQFAYALFYVGDIAKSLQAIDRSTEALSICASSEYELARLDIVRSLVFTAQERYEEAIAAARAAQAAFRAYGDRARQASALLAEAFVLLGRLSYREALPILQSIELKFQYDIDTDTRARVLNNIGLCQWQTGHVADALRAYELSAALHESSGTDTEAARTRLNIAGVLAAEGRHAEAKSRLMQLGEEFRAHGMHFEMVFAGVVLSEILLVEGDHAEVDRLCRAAIEVLQTSGGAYRSQVLTAVGYLHEASVLKRATPATAREVHRYIQRLPHEPNLLFAPAPLQRE